MGDLWYPQAERNPAPSNLWGTYRDDDGRWKYVIHTTEAKTFRPAPSTYYGHTSYPHVTIGEHTIWQHIPINRAARALKNTSTPGETNNDLAVQAEVLWLAAQAELMPKALLDNIRRFGLWVHDVTGMAWQCKVNFHGPEDRPAGVNAKQRMTAAAWDNYEGICGHQHVPENDHWDPGHIDVAYLLRGDTDQEDEMTPEQLKQILDYVEQATNDVHDRVVATLRGEVVARIDQNVRPDLRAILGELENAGGPGGGTVDVDALAAKTADLLAARLKD